MRGEYISKESMGFREFLFSPRDMDADDSEGSFRTLHYHDFYEFQIYTGASGTIFIRDLQHVIQRGDIVLINIFEPHLFVPDNQNYERYCITIDADFLLMACSPRSNLLDIFTSNNPNYPISHIDEDALRRILEIVLRYNSITMEPGYDIYEKALLYELLSRIYNLFYTSSANSSLNVNDLSVIVKLIEYINLNLNRELSLDELAGVVHFSKYYLCKRFKSITGYTLNKYTINKRINKAKLLLMEDIPISDIAMQVGFSNYSHFYKSFLRYEGISPSDYRRRYAEQYHKNGPADGAIYVPNHPWVR